MRVGHGLTKARKMEYVKIHSLWKREGWYFEQGKATTKEGQKDRQSFIVGDYACAEFGNIKRWNVTEKIDGTNVRIHLARNEDRFIPGFYGRHSYSAMPSELFNFLSDKFDAELLSKTIDMGNCTSAILYGEGYGPKIQAAGNKYSDRLSFMLFDVVIGKYWLPRDIVKDIALKLDVPVVPDLGIMTEEQIVEYVKSKPLSQCSLHPQVIEGVVARSEPCVYFKDGTPVMFKLKCKEF
jgi:hypothetical protein